MFTTPPPVAFVVGPPAFGSARQTHDGPSARHTARAEARRRRQAQLAAEALPTLPRSGESVHVLMTGFYDLAAVIAAAVRRLPGCTHLRIATLAMSKRNAAELVDLLAAGKVDRLTLVVSEFYKAHNKELLESIAEDLAPYRSTLAAARNHAKVCTIESPAGKYVIESSANLRCNRCSEFMTVFNDAGLFRFHSRWIDDAAKAKGQAKA